MIQDSGETFRVVSDYEPAGDQAEAIRQLKDVSFSGTL